MTLGKGLRGLLETPLQIAARKDSHIQLCLKEDVESRNASNPFPLPHCALPELNMDAIDMGTTFMGYDCALPMLITGMTGGVGMGQAINEALAMVAQECKIPFGLGSQKLYLRDKSTFPLFHVKKRAPKVFLIGNLGAVSLNYGCTVEDCLRLVETFELNALAMHLNSLQEAIQPEGERNFSQLLEKIEKILKILPVPLLIKEVGAGLDASSCLKLARCGVKYFDLGGTGGTSWAAIEGLRRADPTGQRLGRLFQNWGVTTEQALLHCQNALKDAGVEGVQWVATGGIRSGIDVARMVGQGATLAGVGLPLFRAVGNALEAWPGKPEMHQKSAMEEMEFFKLSLQITLFSTGCPTLGKLQNAFQAVSS